MVVVNMLFLVAIALDRALTIRIMREDIFNRWPRERRGCFAMRDIDVQFTAGLGLLRSPQQRIRPRINKPSQREEGMPMSLTRRLSRRYREPRASRDPETAFRPLCRASYSRSLPLATPIRRRSEDDDDGNGGSRSPLINSATERLPLFAL